MGCQVPPKRRKVKGPKKNEKTKNGTKNRTRKKKKKKKKEKRKRKKLQDTCLRYFKRERKGTLAVWRKGAVGILVSLAIIVIRVLSVVGGSSRIITKSLVVDSRRGHCSRVRGGSLGILLHKKKKMLKTAMKRVQKETNRGSWELLVRLCGECGHRGSCWRLLKGRVRNRRRHHRSCSDSILLLRKRQGEWSLRLGS